MKLTKREMQLLIVAGIIALLAASYYFVIAPQWDKYNAVNEDLASIIQEVEKVKTEIDAIPQLDHEISNMLNELKTTSERFYPYLIQKKFIVVLNELLDKSGVKADSVAFSQPNIVESVVGNTDGNTGTTGPNEGQTQAEGTNSGIGNPQIQYMSIQLPIQGTYNQIMDFIKRLEGLNRMIIINNFQIAQGTDGLLSGSISLDFYSLVKVTDDASDEEFINWPYNSPKGVSNPFRFIPSNDTDEQIQNNQSGEQSGVNEQAEVNESTQTP